MARLCAFPTGQALDARQQTAGIRPPTLAKQLRRLAEKRPETFRAVKDFVAETLAREKNT
jgi:hypothetical protein